jgi:hypothetical protein
MLPVAPCNCYFFVLRGKGRGVQEQRLWLNAGDLIIVHSLSRYLSHFSSMGSDANPNALPALARLPLSRAFALH